MRDEDFEWDDAKAVANRNRHGVLFDIARGVFADPFAVEWFDDREDYGEARVVIVGMVEGRLLCVIYTMREERTRIISARVATVRERRRYHEENA
ncbi:MAG: BrnT family toxin [Caulobacteraceae bacterium]